MLFAAALLGCHCRSDGNATERDPIYEFLSEGSGPESTEPLMQLGTGTRLATDDSELNHPYGYAIEAPIVRNGRNLSRMLFPDGAAYLEHIAGEGVFLHGSSPSTLESRPLLIVPDTVREGMRWTVTTSKPDADWENVVGAPTEVEFFGENRRVWPITRVSLNPGFPSRTAEYMEGIGLIGAGTSATRRDYSWGVVSTANDIEPLVMDERIALTPLIEDAFDGASAHISAIEADGRTILSVHSTYLYTWFVFPDPFSGRLPYRDTRWETDHHCFETTDGSSLTSGGSCHVVDITLEEGETQYPGTHAGLSIGFERFTLPADSVRDLAYGGLPTFVDADLEENGNTGHELTLEVVVEGTDGTPHGLLDRGQGVRHTSRLRMLDLDARVFVGASDPWVTNTHLRTGGNRHTLRAIADSTIDADPTDVLVSHGLGTWKVGAMDESGPSGPMSLAFVKSGLPHIRQTPEGREGLIADPDGAVWRLRLGGDEPVLEFLAMLDLPAGHRLAGVTRLGTPNGPTEGTTLIAATVSGSQVIDVQVPEGNNDDPARVAGIETLGLDTAVTSLWSATLGPATAHPGMAAPLGISAGLGSGTWVCDQDGAAVAGWGVPVVSDDTFSTCRLFAEAPEAPITVGEQTVYADPYQPYTQLVGVMDDDNGFTSLTQRYSPTGLRVDSSPFVHSARYFLSVGSPVVQALRDPWSYDLYAYDLFGGYQQVYVTADGDSSFFGDPLAPPASAAAGGGGRIVEPGVLRLPDGTEMDIAADAVLAWTDGRWCAARSNGVVCLGADGRERFGAYSPTPGAAFFFGREGAVADESLGYLDDGWNLWRVDPDTARVDFLDAIQPLELNVSSDKHQSGGGRVFYIGADGTARSVLDGEISEYTNASGLIFPFGNGFGLDTNYLGGAQTILLDPVPVDGLPPVLAPPGTDMGVFEIGDLDLPDPGSSIAASAPGGLSYVGHTPIDTEGVAFALDGSGLLGVDRDGIYPVDFSSTVGGRTPWPNGELFNVIDFSPQGTLLFASPETVAFDEQQILVLDLEDLSSQILPDGIAAPAWTQSSDDDRTLVSLFFPSTTFGDPAQLKRWDLTTGASSLISDVLTPADPTNAYRWAKLSPNGEVLLVGQPLTEDFKTSVRDAHTGEIIARVEGDYATFSPDGTLLVTDTHVFLMEPGPTQLGVRLLHDSPSDAIVFGSEIVFSPSGEWAAVFGTHVGSPLPVLEIYSVGPTGLSLISSTDVLTGNFAPTSTFTLQRLFWSHDSQQIGVHGTMTEPGVGLYDTVLRWQ